MSFVSVSFVDSYFVYSFRLDSLCNRKGRHLGRAGRVDAEADGAGGVENINSVNN